MSLSDRDFSKVKAKSVASGSQAQCENVLQAALDEIRLLLLERDEARRVIDHIETYHPNAVENARSVLKTRHDT